MYETSDSSVLGPTMHHGTGREQPGPASRRDHGDHRGGVQDPVREV